MKSIKLIKKLVEQELKEIDGGIMDPNMVPFVPHREPAADTADDPKGGVSCRSFIYDST